MSFEIKRDRLTAFLRAQPAGAVRLRKDTSNLFRDREATGAHRIDVRDFDRVIAVDPDAQTVEVEGMTTYADLTAACLERSVMPAVVPQLKSITIGGAVSGIGIESSSFRYGLVHETVDEMEILLADGSTAVCRADNEHAELFHGFPNSYGTLGYALRLKAKVVPVRPFVEIRHERHTDAHAYFETLAERCSGDADFVDGTVFGPGEYYLTTGRFTDQAPYVSDYTFEHIYYRSIREREVDYLSVADYVWRWDTDWFWCSKNVYAQNPIIRRLYGRQRLNSVTYTRIMRLNARLGLMGRLERLLGLHSESVIQDVDIPVDRCVEFLRFYLDTIRFTPVWICPVRAWRPTSRYPLYPLDPATLYVNFGFWDVIRERTRRAPGHYNRLVESKVMELDGFKSLYSDVYFSREELWASCDRVAYERLKARYDPENRFADLYDKCVLRK